VRANAAYVPPAGKGSLHVRTLLLGSGATASFKPAPEYTFVIYVTAVGPEVGGQLAVFAAGAGTHGQGCSILTDQYSG
jgi:branched-chain amino acid aminotransferase